MEKKTRMSTMTATTKPRTRDEVRHALLERWGLNREGMFSPAGNSRSLSSFGVSVLAGAELPSRFYRNLATGALLNSWTDDQEIAARSVLRDLEARDAAPQRLPNLHARMATAASAGTRTEFLVRFEGRALSLRYGIGGDYQGHVFLVDKAHKWDSTVAYIDARANLTRVAIPGDCRVNVALLLHRLEDDFAGLAHEYHDATECCACCGAESPHRPVHTRCAERFGIPGEAGQ